MKRCFSELEAFFKSMNMDVHKIGTNLSSLSKNLPETKLAKDVFLREGESSLDVHTLKTLGLIYYVEKDKFAFPRPISREKNWTLRKMTSAAGSLYDPLGLLAPCTLAVKLLIQEVWREKKEWDEEVPAQIAQKMDMWCKNFKALMQLEIDRYVPYLDHVNLQLYVFTDASSDCQACAVYIRTSGR